MTQGSYIRVFRLNKTRIVEIPSLGSLRLCGPFGPYGCLFSQTRPSQGLADEAVARMHLRFFHFCCRQPRSFLRRPFLPNLKQEHTTCVCVYMCIHNVCMYMVMLHGLCQVPRPRPAGRRWARGPPGLEHRARSPASGSEDTMRYRYTMVILGAWHIVEFRENSRGTALVSAYCGIAAQGGHVESCLHTCCGHTILGTNGSSWCL